MRIGIIADGQAEYRSLPKLVERIESQNKVVKTLYADIQPLAPISQIVAAIKSKLPILKSKSVDMAVILIDRENRNVCPGDWAQEIEQALEKTCGQAGITSFAVVVKDSCYENGSIPVWQIYPNRQDIDF